MPARKAHIRPADIRGLSRLAIDATLGLTRLVETMHHNIARLPGPLGRYTQEPTRGITGLAYRTIEGTTRLVGGGLDALLGQLTALLDREPAATSATREALLAAVNGYTPLYLHYNSGEHVSRNGRALADLLQTLVRAWPAPIESLMIVGHSMGGLVARGACHYGGLVGHGWLRHLRQMVFLGTPHHGAPLERGGNWVNVVLELSPYTAALARLAKLRSAGITDLAHGSIVDQDWQQGDRFARKRQRHCVPLPEGVQCYAIAATTAAADANAGRTLPGDGLVPLQSALGQHADPGQDPGIPEAQRVVVCGLHHLDLLDSPAVCARLRRWLF